MASTERAGTWAQKAPLPVPVGEVGVAELGGRVYVVGGQELEANAAPQWAIPLNMAYDPATDRWQTGAPLPEALSHVGLAALDGKLYAVGGFTGVVHMGPKPAAFVYDPETDKWRRLPDISSARGSVAVAAVGRKLHILGGRQADKVVKRPSPPGAPQMFAAFGTVNMHQIYDPATGKWSTGAPVPGPARDHAGIAVFDERIHLFGGRTADVVDNLARHDVYDPRTDTWSTAAPLPVARSAGAYTVLDGRIIYAGGECKPGGRPQTPYAFDDVTAYDSRADNWEMLAPLPQARHAFGSATVNGVAYFAGGSPVCGAGAMTDMLALTLRQF